MTWFNLPSTFIKIQNHLNVFWNICVFEYIGTLHLFSQIYSNLPLYKMKWNSFFPNILLMLYFNILYKNIVKFFQKFEVGYTQTCTPLENSIMWHPKGVTIMCFHTFKSTSYLLIHVIQKDIITLYYNVKVYIKKFPIKLLFSNHFKFFLSFLNSWVKIHNSTYDYMWNKHHGDQIVKLLEHLMIGISKFSNLGQYFS
jgi:hypothetical protein